MSQVNTPREKLDISLRENGVHSLWRGLEFYAEYREANDRMMAKDAIMFLHHGIELLMKEILVRHSQYLIFEKLEEATRKQKEADKQGVPIFFLRVPSPPRTIAYNEAIERVSVFIKPTGLTEDLLDKLKALGEHRNQLEHYAISIDKEIIESLLAGIIDPLVDLFEAELGDIKRHRPQHIVRIQGELSRIQAYAWTPFDHEVDSLVRQFKGQRVPGHLFSVDDEVILPTFTAYQLNYQPPGVPERPNGFRVVMFCRSTDTSWSIHAQLTAYQSTRRELTVARQYGKQATTIPWLLFLAGSVTDEDRAYAKELGVMLTAGAEWVELKRLLGITGT